MVLKTLAMGQYKEKIEKHYRIYSSSMSEANIGGFGTKRLSKSVEA
jgi:hypothetical protein